MKDYTIVANNKNKTKITFAYDHGLPYKDRIRPALEYGEWKKYPSKALLKINFNDEEMSFFEQKNQIKNSAIYEIGNEFWLDLNDVYLIIPKDNYLSLKFNENNVAIIGSFGNNIFKIGMTND